MRGLLPFDGFFGDTALDHFFSDAPAAYKDYVSVPKVDIEDKKDFYEITCDMPGFTKDQISISYENGILSLSAQKEEQTEEKDDDRHYIRRERSSSVQCERDQRRRHQGRLERRDSDDYTAETPAGN